jgi:hypothetical protein
LERHRVRWRAGPPKAATPRTRRVTINKNTHSAQKAVEPLPSWHFCTT